MMTKNLKLLESSKADGLKPRCKGKEAAGFSTVYEHQSGSTEFSITIYPPLYIVIEVFSG